MSTNRPGYSKEGFFLVAVVVTGEAHGAGQPEQHEPCLQVRELHQSDRPVQSPYVKQLWSQRWGSRHF